MAAKSDRVLIDTKGSQWLAMRLHLAKAVWDDKKGSHGILETKARLLIATEPATINFPTGRFDLKAVLRLILNSTRSGRLALPETAVISNWTKDVARHEQGLWKDNIRKNCLLNSKDPILRGASKETLTFVFEISDIIATRAISWAKELDAQERDQLSKKLGLGERIDGLLVPFPNSHPTPTVPDRIGTQVIEDERLIHEPLVARPAEHPRLLFDKSLYTLNILKAFKKQELLTLENKPWADRELSPLTQMNGAQQECVARIQSLIRKKLREDFSGSVLNEASRLRDSGELTRTLLSGADKLRPARLAVTSPHKFIRESAHMGEFAPDAIRRLSGLNRPIRISTESISVGIIAASLCIKHFTSLEIKIEYPNFTGRDHISTIARSTDPPDFFVAPDGAFHYPLSSNLDLFSTVLPCFHENQCFVVRKSFRHLPGSTIYCYPESSAQLMVEFITKTSEISGQSPASRKIAETLRMCREFVLKAHVKEVGAHEYMRKAEELEDSDVLVLWEPLASHFVSLTHLSLRKLENSWFPVGFSLSANRWWSDPAHENLLADFFEVFVAGWKRCSSDISFAMNLLDNRLDLIQGFGRGAGVDVSSLLR